LLVVCAVNLGGLAQCKSAQMQICIFWCKYYQYC